MKPNHSETSGRESNVISGDIFDSISNLGEAYLRDLLLTAANLPQAATSLPFDISKVLDYAAKYCGIGNECESGTGGEYDSDCTHFLAHCLIQSGVRVNSPSAKCSSGLAIRVNDLAAAFNNSVSKYQNVKRILKHNETRMGDFCFLPGFFGIDKDHGMLLAETATSQGAKVFAHTTNRCAEYAYFGGTDCAYYRIVSA